MKRTTLQRCSVKPSNQNNNQSPISSITAYTFFTHQQEAIHDSSYEREDRHLSPLALVWEEITLPPLAQEDLVGLVSFLTLDDARASPANCQDKKSPPCTDKRIDASITRPSRGLTSCSHVLQAKEGARQSNQDLLFRAIKDLCIRGKERNKPIPSQTFTTSRAGRRRSVYPTCPSRAHRKKHQHLRVVRYRRLARNKRTLKQ